MLATLQKPKLTTSGVRGTIRVTSADGCDKIGQWGGTECYLTWLSDLGPCFVVRSSRHKKGDGTFFRLGNFQKVVATHIADGKVSFQVAHAARQCTVFVHATNTQEDKEMLLRMVSLIRDAHRWESELERDVGRPITSATAERARKRPREVPTDESLGLEGGGSGAPQSYEGMEGGAEPPVEDWSALQDVNNDDNDAQGVGVGDDGGVGFPQPVEPLYRPVAASTDRSGAQPPRNPPPMQRQLTTTDRPVNDLADLPMEQRAAIAALQSGQSVFVTGAAGTGKTHWLRYVLSHVIPRGEIGNSVFVTASTNAAAKQLGGTTLHSFAGLSINALDMTAGTHVDSNLSSAVKKRWSQCKILIIDEVGMVSSAFFDLLDQIASLCVKATSGGRASNRSAAAAALASQKPFGGIQLVLVGDFLQLPPVDDNSSGNNRGGGGGMNGVSSSSPCFNALAWRMIKPRVFEFVTNFRQRSDPKYFSFLGHVRRGEVTEGVTAALKECLQRDLQLPADITPTKIVSRHVDAQKHNDAMLQRLPGDFQTFHAIDTFTSSSSTFGGESSTTGGGGGGGVGYESNRGGGGGGGNTILDRETALLPTLTLKVGAQVVLIAPVVEWLPHYETSMLSTGSLGKVIGFTTQTRPGGSSMVVPRVEFVIPGATVGATTVVSVPYIQLSVENDRGFPIATRTQVPLRLAWAITAHRSQGLTLPAVEIALDRTWFEYGQAYIALSRAPSLQRLRLTALDTSVIRASPLAVAFYQPFWARQRQQQQPMSVRPELIDGSTVNEGGAAPS